MSKEKQSGILLILSLILTSTPLISCQIYQPERKEGRFITETARQHLTLGLSKHEVQKIIGSPVLTPVWESDVWRYYYRVSDAQKPSDFVTQQMLTLRFADDKLIAIN